MKEVYKNWIKEHYPTPESAYSNCDEATRKMSDAFPELAREKGIYYCCFWGERQHWWLQDENGRIVDPTSHQFPSKGNGRYEIYTDEMLKDLPTGICMDCGEPVYGHETFCSGACEAATRAYLSGRLT